MISFFSVILPKKWSKLYTYRSELGLCEGDVVWVPVRKKVEIAVVLGRASERADALQITTTTGFNIGPIGWIERVAEANLCEVGEFLKLCLKKKYVSPISKKTKGAEENPANTDCERSSGVPCNRVRKG